MLPRLKTILCKIEEAEQVFNSNATWKIKKDILWRMDISKDIREAGFDISIIPYNPPDYEKKAIEIITQLRQFRKDLGDIANL